MPTNLNLAESRGTPAGLGDLSIMRRSFIALGLVGLFSAVLSLGTNGIRAADLSTEEKNDGFVNIFNGKDFEGWAGPVDQYEILDGAIQCKKGKGGTIYTKEEYSDFIVRLEFKVPAGGNNGLAIRYPGQGDTAYVGMCELQVLDDNYDKVKGKLDPRQVHGSAYGMVAAKRGFQKPNGEWNQQEVIVKGSTIKVTLNGTVILDCDLATVKEFMANSPHPGKDRTKGYFGFAGHGDDVSFRNVRIKSLAEKK